MCKSCQCEVSGKNPKQQWCEMRDACEHRANEDFCLFEHKGLYRKCTITYCPRMRVKLPKDTYGVQRSYDGVRGKYTTIYGQTKSEAKIKGGGIKHAVGMEKVNEGWLPYEGYVVYFIRLRQKEGANG